VVHSLLLTSLPLVGQTNISIMSKLAISYEQRKESSGYLV
jgi:hypothetical protein